MKSRQPLIVYSFKPRLFSWLALAFILFTVIGTLSHEYGHLFAARLRGNDGHVSYAYMMPVTSGSPIDSLEKLMEKYSNEIKSGSPFPGKVEFDWLVKKEFNDDVIMRAGGPLQTMITGTIALLVIIFYRRSYLKSDSLSIGQWMLVFFSLFWLRQLSFLVMFLFLWFLKGEPTIRGDEVLLEALLKLPPFSIMGTTAAIALVVTMTVIFRFIPLPQRFTFIVSGLTGGCLGYYLWLELLGPVIMP